ncbi:hypothetical protein C0J52_14257 [Blattella germanica]|nr:hypothetical protein C0J52_14257 [Blattella germanica]
MEDDISHGETEYCVHGIKRKINRSQWKKEIAKRRRNSGLGYVSRSGKDIPAKSFKCIGNCCTQKCYKSVNEGIQKNLFDIFWTIGDKQKQDTLLAGLIEKKDIVTRKAGVRIKIRQNAYKYHFEVNGEKTEVCKAFFMRLLQVSEGRLKTVQRGVSNGQVVLGENRGSHDNRPSKLPSDVWVMAKEHWELFPSKQLPYGQFKIRRDYFDDPNLNVLKLHKDFQQYYFEKTNKVLTMKYSTYHRFFKANFSFDLHRPRADICDSNNETKLKLKTEPQDEDDDTIVAPHYKSEEHQIFKDEYDADDVLESKILVQEHYMSSAIGKPERIFLKEEFPT